jgi:hypothetical protein
MTLLARDTATVEKVRVAYGDMADDDRQFAARCVLEGRSLDDTAKLLGLSKGEAASREASMVASAARAVFPHRAGHEHALGELVAVNSQLDSALYALTQVSPHQPFSAESPLWIVMTASGATELRHGSRPPGAWISVETAGTTA